ncbi:28.7 kDa protein [Cordyline virus 4]|uniref:28.7 kDa protein n=1 Tax=Cordyline virus 4 TaxID=1177753 RepID=M1N1W1_9CLOS|nr:28.7 kDa protein [Cordyline virus 4]AGF73894.1 28.7 kDa protein [Cordyline virus 4]
MQDFFQSLLDADFISLTISAADILSEFNRRFNLLSDESLCDSEHSRLVNSTFLSQCKDELLLIRSLHGGILHKSVYMKIFEIVHRERVYQVYIKSLWNLMQKPMICYLLAKFYKDFINNGLFAVNNLDNERSSVSLCKLSTRYVIFIKNIVKPCSKVKITMTSGGYPRFQIYDTASESQRLQEFVSIFFTGFSISIFGRKTYFNGHIDSSQIDYGKMYNLVNQFNLIKNYINDNIEDLNIKIITLI